MDENVKNNQLSDEELDNVTGGKTITFGNSCFHVCECSGELVAHSDVYVCPMCRRFICIPFDSCEEFKNRFVGYGDDGIRCPCCGRALLVHRGSIQ